MGPTITDNERKWLQQVSDGDAKLPIKPFSSLRDKGLVTKRTETAGQRGYVLVDITEAGQAAL